LHKLLYTLFFVSFCFQTFSQVEKDFAIWPNLNIEKKINKRFHVHNKQQIRFNENASRLDNAYNRVGITYKQNPSLNYSFSYVFSLKNKPEIIDKRNRFLVDVTFKKKIYRTLSFYYRSRTQVQFVNYYSSTNGTIPEWDWRNKFTLKLKYYNLKPYISTEVLYNFKDSEGFDDFKRTRYYVGCEFMINQKESFQIYYLFQHQYNVRTPTDSYVLGLGYNIEI
jgi:hypothetical protein